MDKLRRFGVSIENSLITEFDKYLREKSYKNRSEAIRDLIREALVEEEWANTDEKVAGVIVIIYNHHKRELVDNLLGIQHNYTDSIISSQHIHLDHDNCLEIIVVRGKISDIKSLASQLKAIKGVKHATLVKSSLGKNI